MNSLILSGPRVSIFKALLAVWFCCSLLLIKADDEITHPGEVQALGAIKKSLMDPIQHLSNWNSGDPCMSNWTGVLCFNTTRDDGYLHVRELRMNNMNLSGSLSPELGTFSYMEILDFMWNTISGNIPKEISKITSLKLLLLNGNQLTGPLPEELGYFPILDRIQIDQNQISGPLPKSFANLNKTKHFHMNNNSISGLIPSELSRLSNLVHLLLDNNNLSGHLPPELSQMPSLKILQLDNNHFEGSTIPAAYSNMSLLLKLSLRNCSLQGPIPDLSSIPGLAYIDLSSNQLNGSIPPGKLSDEMTTIDISNNNLAGTIPPSFSGFPVLQKMSVANNLLNGSVPSSLWEKRNLTGTARLSLDFENNRFSKISGGGNLPPNVTVSLRGNPICSSSNEVQFCGPPNKDDSDKESTTNSTVGCPSNACPSFYEYAPGYPVPCLCVAPLLVAYRLKSPGLSDFRPYKFPFQVYLASGVDLQLYQLYIDTFEWQKGPRVWMYLKIFPPFISNSTRTFNTSEVLRIRRMFLNWMIPDNDTFGPYEIIDFTLPDPYRDVIRPSSTSGIGTGALVGIVLGAIGGAVTLSAVVTLLILRFYLKKQHATSKGRQLSKISIKIDGVKSFTYEELALATNNFSSSSQVGQGGYGKVYKGTLTDGTVVAIKRAQQGSRQGEREFLTEIELLSRLHHRNLVSLIGYCDEETEQMLVYEFMPHGTLRDHLSGKFKECLTFAMRLRTALGSAKGILYLHTEADPPIFHRDIKSSNILLDSKYNAKVADFGLSRLAPVPDIEGFVPAHVSTIVKGTPGYLDPEYFLTRKLTDKSDVYSLGVVFLELLTGMHPISHGKNIVREVNLAYQSGMIFSVIDEHMGSYPSECVEKFASLALKCCQEETDSRPSMAEVFSELEKICFMMPETDNKGGSLTNDPKKTASPLSSSSTTKNPYVSSDISGSNLMSGVIPNIVPR